MRCCIGASNYLELRIVDCFFLSVLRIISLSISAFGEPGEDKGLAGDRSLLTRIEYVTVGIRPPKNIFCGNENNPVGERMQ